MSTGFEIPSFDSLVAEQAIVQAEKFQGRLLNEYTDYLFPGQLWLKPRGSAIADFVRPIIGDTELATLENVLKGLSITRSGEPVQWADMGGGRGLPMRQLASNPDFRQSLQMTNVDLFNFGLKGITDEEYTSLERFSPGMTEPAAEPLFINDNIETVQLPVKADVITSVEAIQYLNNPLEAIANWYNQLADNGMLFVTTEHGWSSWIRYSRQSGYDNRDETPMKHVLEALSQAGINYAATDTFDYENGIRTRLDNENIRIMAIQKKPGTVLQVKKPLTEVWVNPYDYKAAYYEAPTEESHAIIEVIGNHIPTALGTSALRYNQ